jgi:A/G-specific adenine glycosylase
LNSKKTISFRRALSTWFHKSKRDLPWRQTRDPYAILVSEIMLQQTQAATVIPYYNRWLRRFPTIRSLASATESEVLHAWEGLGYYARARNLHRCANTIFGKLGGKFPNRPDALRSLPGIGRYTANAIAVFAFNRSLPIVEANTARVLTRLFNIRAPIDSTHGRQELWKLSAKLVPQNTARDFQNAMMDLGALICT